MTDITSVVPEVEPTAKPAAELNDHIGYIRSTVHSLEIAIEELEGALDWLDDEGFPESVRDLAASMSHAAGEVHWGFDCGNFYDQVAELEEPAGEESAP